MGSTGILLLTDIVDSTRLNESRGDEVMRRVWAEHDRGARAAMRLRRGREVARSDGFLVLFTDAADALRFAADYHRLAAGLAVPLKARVGVHAGPFSLRANSAADARRGAPQFEVDGVALPVAARVMSAAAGGQTLATRAALHELPPGVWRTRSHGYWRLKGIDEPIELLEVGDADSPFEPPPDSEKAWCVVERNGVWVPRREVPHRLAAERDAFVGRAPQLQELARRFDDGARLVSILGTGGTGKTRLASRFGWTWLADYTGGVWFVDLSQAHGVDGIAHAVAMVLELPLGGADPVEQLARAIQGRGRCLLILDNFEQVARHAPETLGLWLDRAPQAHFIVTTREVLGLAGEQVLNLAPLPPAESAALFRERASALGHRLTADDEAVLDRLVALLDGLPLAIELAAARVRIMSPRALLERMSERFTLLSSGGTRRDRQATLRSTFDWSWDLLSEPERAALAQLAVFDGGFGLAAAEAVLRSAGAPLPIDLVQALVDKSFVRRLNDHRFSMLQSIQEYVLDQFRQPGRFEGDRAAALADSQARHWRYFAALDERAQQADGCVEIDNLVSACRRAAAAGAADAAVRNLVGAWLALRMTGPFRVGLDLALLVERLPGLDTGGRAAVDWVAGSACQLTGQSAQAQARFDSALAGARAAGDAALEAQVLCARADLRSTAGRLEGVQQDLDSALQLARSLGDASLEYKALNGFGALAVDRGDLAAARRRYEAALALAQREGDRRWEGGLLSNLGAIHFTQGRFDEAAEHYERALALVRTVGDRRWEGSARCNLALLHHEQGRHREALEQFGHALRMAREMGHPALESSIRCNLGLVTEAMGDLEAARLHYEEAVAIAQALGTTRALAQFRGYLGQLYAKLGRRQDARACLDAGEDLLRDGADRLSLALLLCNRTQAEAMAGDADAARQACGRAQAIWEEWDRNPDSELGRAIAAARRAVHC